MDENYITDKSWYFGCVIKLVFMCISRVLSRNYVFHKLRREESRKIVFHRNKKCDKLAEKIWNTFIVRFYSQVNNYSNNKMSTFCWLTWIMMRTVLVGTCIHMLLHTCTCTCMQNKMAPITINCDQIRNRPHISVTFIITYNQINLINFVSQRLSMFTILANMVCIHVCMLYT